MQYINLHSSLDEPCTDFFFLCLRVRWKIALYKAEFFIRNFISAEHQAYYALRRGASIAHACSKKQCDESPLRVRLDECLLAA